jgi:hypothetical protein
VISGHNHGGTKEFMTGGSSYLVCRCRGTVAARAQHPVGERTLADRERVLDAEHPDTLASRDSLAAARRLLHGESSAGGGSLG